MTLRFGSPQMQYVQQMQSRIEHEVNQRIAWEWSKCYFRLDGDVWEQWNDVH